jgi:Ulp1 family protease
MAKKKAARVKSAGKTKNDPAQQTLPGVEESRIPTIETAMKRIIAAKSEKISLVAEIKDLEDKIAGLLSKNGLTQYKCLERIAVLESGAATLKIKRVKSQA